MGILDPDCIRLAQLHSDATDYPKSGMPVPMHDIPRYKWANMKPDWNAPELAENARLGLYYESRRYIGRLYREVQLSIPEVKAPHLPPANGRLRAEEVLQTFRNNDFAPHNPVETAVYDRVLEFISVNIETHYTAQRVRDICEIFDDYVRTLHHISASFTISHRRAVRLTEEEIVAGTIIAQSSQRNMRKEVMSQMREQASILVNRIAAGIIGVDEESKVEALKRAWIAYRISTLQPSTFGSRSFSVLAMHEIFDAIKSIETISQFVASSA